MTIANETDFHTELQARREHVATATRLTPRRELQDLLADIDAALARLEHGTFGICDVCHDAIEADRLVHDPLAQCCSDHVTAWEEARVQRDLMLARDVQLALLPRLDQPIHGWQYHYRYQAAGQVGGDFCDVIAVPVRGETLILVGDVAGKGIAASMVMSSVLATFRSLSSLGLPTGELLTRVNNLFYDSAPRSSYATLVAASLLPNGAIDLYSAGHWPPLIRSRQTDPLVIEAGLPLGMFRASRYTPTRIELGQNDTLLFYTDGAIDAENSDGENYTVDRLARTLAESEPDRAGLPTLVDHCFRDVRQFQNGRAPGDDLLLFAVRRGSEVFSTGGDRGPSGI